MSGTRIFSIVAGFIGLFIVAISATSIIENVDSGEIVVIQDAWDGDLTVHTKPGVVWQWFGTVTTYHHSNQFWFEPQAEGDTDDGAARRGCFNMRFNDNGTAQVCGSATFDLPTDTESVLTLHRKHKSMEGVVQRLVKTSLSKSIYNTGPLMSSRESANEKRGDLTRYVIGQATEGIYKVEITTEEVPDLGAEPVVTVTMVDEPVLNVDGTVKLTEDGQPVMHAVAKKSTKPAVKKSKISRPLLANGKHVLQERSALTDAGITLYNLTITSVIYDNKVKGQIAAQQAAIMSIQTARATSLSAQQAAITAKAEGAAREATAVADERVLTAKETAQAERRVVVARQSKIEAELKAEALLAEASAKAKAKKLLAEADGSLAQKLAAWTKAQEYWAAAAAKQPQVPQVTIGAQGSGTKGGATSTIQDLMTLQLTRQLGLDMGIKKGKNR